LYSTGQMLPNGSAEAETTSRTVKYFVNTGLFKKKHTISKIYFAKTTDAKSMSCVRMERKSLKVLISMI
jgi:hypothetical protein